MNTEIQNAFQQSEKIRIELGNKMSKFSDAQLNQKPLAGGWSAMQTAYHLITAETFSLGYLQKKIQAKDKVKSAGIMHSLRSALLRLFLSLPIKFKAPKIVEQVPDFKAFTEMKEDWDKTRKGMSDLLETLTDEDVKRELFKHPLAGRMNILQMMDFFNDHLTRHIKQIEKCLKG
jgi:hypothetical protein